MNIHSQKAVANSDSGQLAGGHIFHIRLIISAFMISLSRTFSVASLATVTSLLLSSPAYSNTCFYDTYVALMADKFGVSQQAIASNLPAARTTNMITTSRIFSESVRRFGSSYVLSEISKQYDDPVDIAVMAYCVALFEIENF